MKSIFDKIASAVTARPRLALAGLLVATLALASGFLLASEQADGSAFLPVDSDVARAGATLDEAFPDSAGLASVTVLHVGDVLTPAGLDHLDRVLAAATSEAAVAERLALADPVNSISGVFKQVLGVEDLSGLSQAEIDEAITTIEADPRFSRALDGLTGEADGQEVALTAIKLRALGDPDALGDVELLLADTAEAVDGPLEVRTLSATTINDESQSAIASSMLVLMALALVVIAVLLFVFFRSGSDVALSLAGLAITLIGTIGVQGLLGPDGIGLIGAPNSLTSAVPIMLIGLVVDYAIQYVAHYREMRETGAGVVEAATRGLRGVMLPLVLAAGTTIIAFLTNLTSPLPANADFGIVAAFGVFFGLVTMLTLVPAARTIFDQRSERNGTLREPRLLTNAIPGAGSLIARLSDLVARRPGIVLVVGGLITIGLGTATFNLKTEFNTTDFLPTDGESVESLDTLNQAFDGQTEIVTALVEAELTDDRTLRNLLDLDTAFSDELSRPTGAQSGITESLGTLFEDWATDSGAPDDNYTPDLNEIASTITQGLSVDPDAVQALLDRLAELDPQGFAQVAVDNPDGPDLTLIQFNALTGDQDRTQQMVDDIEGLWFGDRDQITATSGDITSLEVTSSMTDSQTTSILTTIVAALVVLTLFFWVTEFKPMLAVIAVVPVGLVLVWVLGTMTVLGIPYNIITALVTALSIGIGVDYTIHIIHRFSEEFHRLNDVAQSIKITMATTGSALIGSALSTALGFGVLIFSPLGPFQQFGLVIAITIMYSLLAAILIVPPLLILWAAYHQWRQTTIDHTAPADHTPTPAPIN